MKITFWIFGNAALVLCGACLARSQWVTSALCLAVTIASDIGLADMQ